MRRFMNEAIGAVVSVLTLIALPVSIASAQTVQYGVYIGDQSVVAPTTNFNLYSAGRNSKNVFEGNVGIGTSPPNINEAGTAAVLTVYDNGGSTGDRGILELGGNFTTDNLVGEIAFLNTTINNTDKRLAAIFARRLGADYQGLLDFLTTASAGSPLVRMRITSNGNVGIGTTDPVSLLHVNGTLTANTKNFQIAHPVEPDRKLLVHSALEGPEVAVYYRGEAQLVAGQVSVVLPAYFEALVRQEQRTVQLTPIDGWAPLYVERGVQEGRFTVRTANGGNPAQRFYWEVKAVRADVAPLVVEMSKKTE